MKDKVKLCLKIAWLSAAVVILVMGTGMCAANDEACYQAGGAMFVLMFWLSFPSGLVFSLAALAFVDHQSIHYPSDFISAWMVMAFGGLLQWFVIVPHLFERRYFTQLNLSADASITQTPAPELIVPTTSSSPDNQTNRAPEAVVAPSVLNATLLEPPAPASPNADKTQSRRKKIPPGSIRSIAPFDQKGRTPLQRVIDSL